MSLPQFYFMDHPTESGVIMIVKGQDGYRTSPYVGISASEMNQRFNNEERHDISQAMLAGSMFGWHTPAADPRYYNEEL